MSLYKKVDAEDDPTKQVFKKMPIMPNTKGIIIRVNNISKHYDKNENKVEVFSNFSLDILEGSITGIVGKSGSGKSTLLHIVGGLDSPNTGEVIFYDKDEENNTISAESIYMLNENAINMYRNENLGFVFQLHYLLEAFTALENVIMPAYILRDAGRIGKRSIIAQMKEEEVMQRAESLLELVGLGDRKHHYPNELSGGEQQRVAIARSMMNKPRLILADEPTGSLDKHNSSAVFDIFQKLTREFGVSIMLVTHDPDIAKQCDYIARLDKN